MSTKQKNTALVAAVIAGLCSLPLTWITVRNAQVETELGEMSDVVNSMFRGMTIQVTGLDGSLTFLVKIPIWLVVSIAIFASILQLMRHSEFFAIPRIAEWITAVVALLWTSIPAVLVLLSGSASLGVGWVLGILSAAIPFVCLLIPTRDGQKAKNHEIES